MPASRPSELPQTKDRWGLLTAQLRLWITPEGEAPYQPYIVLVLDLTRDKLLANEIMPQPPTADEIESALAQAMLQPGRGAGRPRRPAELVLTDAALAETLSPALARVGVQGRVQPLPELQAVVAELEDRMRGGRPEPVGLLTTAGVTPDLAGSLFAAAAEFYRAAPWVALNNAQALAVSIPPEREPARIVAVMGNAGMQYGLAVYERWSDFEKTYLGGDDLSELIAPEGNLSLWYEDVTAVPFADLDALRAHGWPVAGEHAYPIPVRFFAEGRLARPGPEDLHWLETALLAIARAVREGLRPDGQGDYAPLDLTLTVPAHAGPTPVRLTYPAGKLDLARRSVVEPEWDQSEDEPDLPDRRAMEGAMAGLGTALGSHGGPADPQLRAAQQLMYQAWEADNPAHRLALAHQALTLSPDCADAYVLLAEEEADTAARALQLYEQGVAAGERALGGQFQANVGHFWGVLETRPYMRARAGLAETLWSMNRRTEAAAHYRELLRLNPADNQGNRYALLNLLLQSGEEAGARDLLGQYDDGLAEWQYTRALLEFKRSGAGPAAQPLARAALEQNAHVPAYLTGQKRLPLHLPPSMGWGDENEAQHYAARYLNLWRQTPGAVEWLAGQTSARPKGPQRGSGRGRRPRQP